MSSTTSTVAERSAEAPSQEPVPHDKDFKNAILDYLQPALQFICPAETVDLPPDAVLTPLRQEQTVQQLGWPFRETDVPVLVDSPTGGREAFVVLIEEETDASRFDIIRLAEYALGASRLFKTDRVVPTVLFIGPGGHPASELELGTERETFLKFHYVACRLAELPVESYRDTTNPFAALNLPLMRHSPARHLEVCEHATDRFFELEPDDRKRAKYLPFIEMEGRLRGAEMLEFRRWLRWESRWRSTVESMFDALRKEATDAGRAAGLASGMASGLASGLASGMASGLASGVLRGRAEDVLRILDRRRLPLTDEQRQRVLGCQDLELLDRWLDAAIDSGSVDEVFGVTEAH